MGSVLEAWMSDINLLNKPGIQNGKDPKVKEYSIKLPKEKVYKEKNNINEKNNLNFFLWGGVSVCLITLVVIFSYTKSSDITKNSNLSISYLLNMVLDDYDKFQLNSINHVNRKINVVFESKTEEKLYEKLELFKTFNYFAKGSQISDKFYLHIKDDWHSVKNAEWNLLKFKKHIKDFKGIEYELFNNKIIIISNISDLISIINVCEKNKILNYYTFNISKIIDDSDNNYYKLIIEDYD